MRQAPVAEPHCGALQQVHFAEEWNEIHHLMIMESLGGDQLWIDRFMAQHAAVFYYWVLVFFFAFSPSLAYTFSEMVEVRPQASDQGLGAPQLRHVQLQIVCCLHLTTRRL